MDIFFQNKTGKKNPSIFAQFVIRTPVEDNGVMATYDHQASLKPDVEKSQRIYAKIHHHKRFYLPKDNYPNFKITPVSHYCVST